MIKSPYKQMAELLSKKLSKAEFLRLQELLDGDANDQLWEAITARAARLSPALFGSDRNEKPSAPGHGRSGAV